ncbi:MAG: dihydroorotate dehydrogenase-like protein, partial [Anaerolineae bacterium]|nr:dihydroorotate dehydrogenase-like protein [Anaerolineae bacterium]
MVDITTTYLGLKLRSPLVVSACPLSEKVENIKRMEDAGAGAVVLFSLFEEQIRREREAMQHYLLYGTESYAEALTYFPEPEEYHAGTEDYLKLIADAKASVNIPVIASLNGSSLGGWTKFARKMEEAGADALELNVYYIPTNMNMTGEEVENAYIDILHAVKSAVKIPVAMKLSPFFSNMAYMAKRLDMGGANALVLFNRFYQPDIDLETREVTPNVILSTPQAMRLPLTWVAILFGRIQADLAATSGIHTPTDVIKMIMAGANVTMMASALLRSGIDHLNVVETGMRQWMEEHEY